MFFLNKSTYAAFTWIQADGRKQDLIFVDENRAVTELRPIENISRRQQNVKMFFKLLVK